MRGLDLAAEVQDIAVRANKHLREIASRHINLTVAQRDIYAVLPRRSTDPPHLVRIRGQAVFAVCLEEGQRLLIIDLPHPVRIPGDPNFREGDEAATCCAGFVDPFDGLLDGEFEVEPAGFSSHGRGLVLFDLSGHGRYCLTNCKRLGLGCFGSGKDIFELLWGVYMLEKRWTLSENGAVEVRRTHPALFGNRKAIKACSAQTLGDLSGGCLDVSRLGDCTKEYFQTLPFCALTWR